MGTLWVKSGHAVLFSSRHPGELKKLVDGLGPLARAGTVREALAELTAEHPDCIWRLVKAANIVAVRIVERSEYNAGWWVESETEAGKYYFVLRVDGRDTCSCQDYLRRGGPCNHGLAVELLQRCERRDAEADDPTICVHAEYGPICGDCYDARNQASMPQQLTMLCEQARPLAASFYAGTTRHARTGRRSRSSLTTIGHLTGEVPRVCSLRPSPRTDRRHRPCEFRDTDHPADGGGRAAALAEAAPQLHLLVRNQTRRLREAVGGPPLPGQGVPFCAPPQS